MSFKSGIDIFHAYDIIMKSSMDLKSSSRFSKIKQLQRGIFYCLKKLLVIKERRKEKDPNAEERKKKYDRVYYILGWGE